MTEMENWTPNIIILGTGKVAQQIGMYFHQLKFPVKGVWGRNQEKAEILAKKIETKSLKELPKNDTSSLLLICVSDNAIPDLIQKLSPQSKIAYTSGSVKLEDLPPYENLGVFYPLQSFSEGRNLDFEEIPFLIEAKKEKYAQELVSLAQKISKNVRIADSRERYLIHIAAVMVNNFTNYLMIMAEEHLKEHHLDFSILRPLIKETVHKLDVLSPHEAQTGPALRGDWNIIQKHMETLSNPDSKELYQTFSKLIEKEFKDDL